MKVRPLVLEIPSLKVDFFGNTFTCIFNGLGDRDGPRPLCDKDG